jgi:hypothetical protein
VYALIVVGVSGEGLKEQSVLPPAEQQLTVGRQIERLELWRCLVHRFN